MYLCVKGIDFASFYDFFYCILELFRQCGIFVILLEIHIYINMSECCVIGEINHLALWNNSNMTKGYTRHISPFSINTHSYNLQYMYGRWLSKRSQRTHRLQNILKLETPSPTINSWRGRHDRKRMVVGFTITFAYHHYSCEFESRSWQGVLDTALCDKVCQFRYIFFIYCITYNL